MGRCMMNERDRSGKILLIIVLLLGLVAGAWKPASASAPQPVCQGEACVAPFPPEAEGLPAIKASATPEEEHAPLNLPFLKAVLVVGPIDGDTGAWTSREIRNMERLAEELVKNGVEVHKFYTPNNDWAEIVAAASGAHFLVYRGHGISWGGNPEEVGGFALKNKFVRSAEISRDLKLAPNAVVMLYACYAAGTTSTDTPPGISLDEAKRRVAQYSKPFFDAGAAAYYADWYGQAFQVFAADLFAGKTLGEAYKNFDFDPTTFSEFTHPDHPQQVLWLDSHFFADQTQYNHAFAGQPDKTLEDLFAAQMEIGPEKVELVAPPDAPAQEVAIQIENSQPTVTFAWNASLVEDVGWVQLTRTNGVSGEALTFSVNPSGMEAGVYTTEVQISTETPGVLNSESSVPVTLVVVQNSPTLAGRLFLPMVAK